METDSNGYKPSFIKIVRQWVIISLVILAAVLFFIQTINSTRDAGIRAKEKRARYFENQRGLIKYEVNSVVRIVDYEVERALHEAKAVVKDRVYQAYSVAQNIYDQHAGSKSGPELQNIVVEALRPVRFDQGNGYFIMADLNGITKLLPNRPDLEGTDLSELHDGRGNYFVRDSMEIAKNQGEGFCQYFRPKPDRGKGEYEKIAYIKHFEPFNWYICTGVYLDTVEARMQNVISHYVDTNRFGANGQGYVFIIDLLNINGGENFGRVYANPARPNDTGKFISDDYRDARGKEFRKEFLKGLREDGECYVEYWFPKIDNPEPSHKLGFFKLAGNGRFIVSAGVYVDDIEGEIEQMHQGVKLQSRRNTIIIASIFFPAILIAILRFHFLSKRLQSDYNLFIDFFERAVNDSEFIDRDRVKFGELDRLAEFANQMLRGKEEVEEALKKKNADLDHWVGQQKKTQDELRKSEEQYRVLVENAKDAIFVFQKGRLKFSNSVMEKIMGYSQEELRTMSGADVFHPDDCDEAMAAHAEWFRGSQPAASHRPYRFFRKNGEIAWGQFSIVRVEWEGSPATLSFLRDVTQQKELEKKLMQGQKLEAIGTLAGGIAHDFNNILSGLLGYTQLALNEVTGMPATQRKLTQVLNAAERAADLVKQILSFSRSQNVERKPVSPRTIINEVLKLIRASIPANIEIKKSLKSEGCVLADPTQLHQVVMNLCTNAAHAMKETGGVLSVTLQDAALAKEDLSHQASVVPGDFIKISIEDTGTGMTREVQEKAFDPFFTTKGPGEGTGMGLSSVHGIITDLGGFLSLYSEPGQGTVMHVFLPLIPETGEAGSGAEEEPIEGGSERILFVDDEPTQRELAEDALSKYGYRVMTFGDSTAAAAHFQQNSDAYDLVITDMTMPKMTGDLLTRKIRSIRPEIPVIMCTGYSEIMDENRAKRLQIDAFLYKPVIIANMLRTIRRVFEQKR